MDPSHLPIKTIVLYTNSGDDSLAVIRVLGPARQLGLNVIRGVESNHVNVDAVRQGDIILLQRDFPVNLGSYEEVLALARSLGKPVIFDLDDLLFALPENHPDRLRFHFTDALLPMLQAVMEADLVTVTTAPLREYLLPFNNNIAIVPNFLNDDLWHFNQPSKQDTDDGKITIGYMGGHSHRPDLRLVLPALLSLVNKYPGKIRYHFWGIEPPKELDPYSIVDWYPPASLLYADFVEYFLTQTADIVIAPLEENLFNSCKSSIKYLEYGAFGSPGVYSRVRPYSDIVTDGINGFLASTTDEWVNCLSKLIEDRDLRNEIAQNAQQNIRENWLLSQNANRQLRVYVDAVARISQPKNNYLPVYWTVKSLSHKLSKGSLPQAQPIEAASGESLADAVGAGALADQPEEQKNITQLLKDQIAAQIIIIKLFSDQLAEQGRIIESLTTRLNAQNISVETLTSKLAEFEQNYRMLANQLEEREQEALSYALSRSWRVTRPFRNFLRKFNKPGLR